MITDNDLISRVQFILRDFEGGRISISEAVCDVRHAVREFESQPFESLNESGGTG